MSGLGGERFCEFYRAATRGKNPFPWQERLARRVCDPTRGWPRAIALPTAAGKTACIDVAVFALACQAGASRRTAPRRVFFVVDRRVVVDQAFRHATELSRVLNQAESGILREVSDALRKLGGERPLDVYALRGGMYRETAWAHSPLQPTVIASTVDQVGSRLLFRGYGVSDSMKPIHAGLVGNDALILLDEAHCARPFAQTLAAVEKYRAWTEEPAPLRFVSLGATVTAADDLPAGEIERDDEDDRNDPVLGKRIAASKPATLIVAEKARGKTRRQWGPALVAELASHARGLIDEGYRAVGVIVNRVQTARELAEALRKPEKKKQREDQLPDVLLLTGRMRPVDSKRVLSCLEPLYSGSTGELKKPTVVVATQCLEVGADLDFHALVSECASLDALRQRFGRLNRVAARPEARAVIVIRGDQTEDTTDDPVYGESVARTWKWLEQRASGGVIDFGIAAMQALTDGMTADELALLNAPAADAPVLFPVHLDCWVQTSPRPSPDPDPAVFLHGPQSGVPDVQVVLRGDLGDDEGKWSEVVSLCPPSSSEAVGVRIDVFRRWLGRMAGADESGDVEGEPEPATEDLCPADRKALRWKGPEDSQVIVDPALVRPGDTLIVPRTVDGLEVLGDFPRFPPDDCGDEAYQQSRDRAILRLTPGVREVPGLAELSLDDEDFEERLSALLEGLIEPDSPGWLRLAVEHLCEGRSRIVEQHPVAGLVIAGKRRLKQFDPAFPEDDESSSDSPSGEAVTLEEHSRGVAAWARGFAAGCGLDVDLYDLAGRFHDLGKLDLGGEGVASGDLASIRPRAVRTWRPSRHGAQRFGAYLLQFGHARCARGDCPRRGLLPCFHLRPLPREGRSYLGAARPADAG